uniref:NADH-ubiquinone oxidoreductase chain 6 n=1 Tax=Ophiocomina nigra TaxID=55617 RepID=D3H5U7_9ECHI|nr:NADH dehydrogenase subunit 6 [Ophiocomina nigra]
MVVGSLILFFSLSPYFSVFGILVQALSLSIIFCLFGFPFFSLLLILIYAGGMLVVFLFSTLLTAERHPESIVQEIVLFGLGSMIVIVPLVYSWETPVNSLSFVGLNQEMLLGNLFSVPLAIVTCVVAFVLLIALMGVLSINFEHTYSNLRKL